MSKLEAHPLGAACSYCSSENTSVDNKVLFKKDLKRSVFLQTSLWKKIKIFGSKYSFKIKFTAALQKNL